MALAPPSKQYWFPAKRYGWGWGPPAVWQGWVVLIAFLLLLPAGALLFPPKREVVGFLVYTSILSAALISVCWLKGEPPRWRWGEDG